MPEEDARPEPELIKEEPGPNLEATNIMIGHKADHVIFAAKKQNGVLVLSINLTPDQADDLARWIITAAVRARGGHAN